jgi:hypothetical protein
MAVDEERSRKLVCERSRARAPLSKLRLRVELLARYPEINEFDKSNGLRHNQFRVCKVEDICRQAIKGTLTASKVVF